MDWIFTVIGFTFIVFLFVYNKYSRKKFNKQQENSSTKVLMNIRENWKEIKIKTDNCTVINYDTKVNKNSPTYSLTNENETFYEWLDKDPNRIDLVDLARTKIVCDYINNGNVKKQYSTIIDMDKTVVEFKLRMRDYLSVYLSGGFEDENYIIDLEFLNEEIDISKFK